MAAKMSTKAGPAVITARIQNENGVSRSKWKYKYKAWCLHYCVKNCQV